MRKHSFIKLNGNQIMESKYHFAMFSELVDLRNEQSAAGKSIISFLMKEYNQLQSCQKNQTWIWWSLWIQLPVCWNYRAEKNMLDCTMTMQSSKIQIVWNCRGTAFVLQQIYCEKEDESWNLCIKGVLKDTSV